MTSSPRAEQVRTARRGERVGLSSALFPLVLALAACRAPAEVRIVTSANAYAYYHARYEEKCVEAVGPATCDAQFALLERWKGRLAEAETALKRGGRLPLQLGELQKTEKEARRWGR